MQPSLKRDLHAVAPSELTDDLLAFIRIVMRASQGPLLAIIEDLGLSLTQTKMLWALDGSDSELTLSAVAELLGLSPAATSRAADDLVRRDLLSRREADHDRRLKLLALTDTGRAALEAMEDARRQGALVWAESLTEEQRGRASASLTPLLDLVDEVRQQKQGTPA